MSPAIRLIVGLGNPGAEYAGTRHNAGFWFVDTLARRYNAEFRPESKFHGHICRIQVGRGECWLLKPATFMNRSGRSVVTVLNYYRIPLEQMLVIHDELELDSGIIRLKQGGGHAGHNGLRDIMSAIGGRDFWRLRVGISRPTGTSGQQLVNYVLGRPSREQTRTIEDAIAEAGGITADLLSGDFKSASSRLPGVG
ncbi:MAG: aminoacyl-tRNA hydrolase [Gammaproteobacteria bacterium]|nr:aminoacyl-tRNA hydrolase [Gammaproteobacteria bacterium]